MQNLHALLKYQQKSQGFFYSPCTQYCELTKACFTRLRFSILDYKKKHPPRSAHKVHEVIKMPDVLKLV